MFSLSSNQSSPNYNPFVTGGNDPSITNVQKYAQMIQNSKGVTYNRGIPNLANTSYTATNPIFSGDILIHGNIHLQSNIGGIYSGYPGYLNVDQNVSVGGTIYTTNLCISGNLLLQPNTYFNSLNVGYLTAKTYSSTYGYVNILNVVKNSSLPLLIMLGDGEQMPMYYSKDRGITWTVCNFAPYVTQITNIIINNYFLTLAREAVFNGIYWIVVGFNTTKTLSIMYSDDGITWIPVDNNNFFNISGGYGVAYDGTRWIACGNGIDDVNLVTSTDGINWTAITTSIFAGGDFPKSIVNNGILWVAGGGTSDTTLAYSYDGYTWIALDDSVKQLLYGGCTCVKWNGTLLLACGGGGGVNGTNFAYASMDDITFWTSYYCPLFVHQVKGIRWSNYLYQWIAIGTGSTGSNGSNGSNGSTGSTGITESILARSNDGMTWTDISELQTIEPNITNVIDVFWEESSKLWFATCKVTTSTTSSINKIFTSSDGISWSIFNDNTGTITQMMTNITCNTIVTNFSNTGILNVTGKANFLENVDVIKSVIIRGNVPATSQNTGTLVVQGGVGINQTMYVGGNAYVTGSVFYKNTPTDISWVQLVNQNQSGQFNMPIYINSIDNFNGIGSNALNVNGGIGVQKNIFIGGTNDSFNVGTGAIVVSGGAGIMGNVNIGKNVNVNGNIAANGQFNLNGSANITNNLLVNGTTRIINDVSMGGNVNVQKNMYIQSNQDSADYSSGALVVVGGMGIGGNFNSDGKVFISSLNHSTDTNTGSLVVSGGAGFGQDIFVGGLGHFINTQDSTSIYDGTLTVDGGVGIQKTLNVGTGFQVGPNWLNVQNGVVAINSNLTNSLQVNGGIQTTGNITMTSGNIFGYVNGVVSQLTNFDACSNIFGTTAFQNDVIINNTSPTALIIAGGIDISGGISIANGAIYVDGATGYFTVNSNMMISNTFPSTGTASGAFVLAGGAGIGGDMNIGGSIVSSNNLFQVNGSTGNVEINSTGGMYSQTGPALTVAGDVVMGNNTYVGGNTSVGNQQITDPNSPLYQHLRLYYPLSTAALVDCSSGLTNTHVSYTNNGGCYLRPRVVPPPPVGSANNSNGDGNDYALYIPTTHSSISTDIYVPVSNGFTMTFWSKYNYSSTLATPLITLYDNLGNHLKLKSYTSSSGAGRQMIDMKMGSVNSWNLCDTSTNAYFPMNTWIFNMVSVSLSSSTSTVFWQSYGSNGSNYQIASTLPVVFNPTLTQMTIGSYTISDISYYTYDISHSYTTIDVSSFIVVDVSNYVLVPNPSGTPILTDTSYSSYVLIPDPTTQYVFPDVSYTVIRNINSLPTNTTVIVDVSYFQIVDSSQAILIDSSYSIFTDLSYAVLTDLSYAVLTDLSYAVLTDLSYAVLTDLSYAVLTDLSYATLTDLSYVYLTDTNYVYSSGSGSGGTLTTTDYDISSSYLTIVDTNGCVMYYMFNSSANDACNNTFSIIDTTGCIMYYNYDTILGNQSLLTGSGTSTYNDISGSIWKDPYGNVLTTIDSSIWQDISSSVLFNAVWQDVQGTVWRDIYGHVWTNINHSMNTIWQNVWQNVWQDISGTEWSFLTNSVWKDVQGTVWKDPNRNIWSNVNTTVWQDISATELSFLTNTSWKDVQGTVWKDPSGHVWSNVNSTVWQDISATELSNAVWQDVQGTVWKDPSGHVWSNVNSTVWQDISGTELSFLTNRTTWKDISGTVWKDASGHIWSTVDSSIWQNISATELYYLPITAWKDTQDTVVIYESHTSFIDISINTYVGDVSYIIQTYVNYTPGYVKAYVFTYNYDSSGNAIIDISYAVLSDVSYAVLTDMSYTVLTDLSYAVLTDLSYAILTDLSYAILTDLSYAVLTDLSYAILTDLSYAILTDMSYVYLTDTSYVYNVGNTTVTNYDISSSYLTVVDTNGCIMYYMFNDNPNMYESDHASFNFYSIIDTAECIMYYNYNYILTNSSSSSSSSFTNTVNSGNSFIYNDISGSIWKDHYGNVLTTIDSSIWQDISSIVLLDVSNSWTNVHGTVWRDIYGNTWSNINSTIWKDISGTELSNPVWKDVQGTVWRDISGHVWSNINNMVWNDISSTELSFLTNTTWKDVQGTVWRDICGHVWSNIQNTIWQDISGTELTILTNTTWKYIQGTVWRDICGHVWSNVNSTVWQDISNTELQYTVWKDVQGAVWKDPSGTKWTNINGTVWQDISGTELSNITVWNDVQGAAWKDPSGNQWSNISSTIWQDISYTELLNLVWTDVQGNVWNDVCGNILSNINNSIWKDISYSTVNYLNHTLWNNTNNVQGIWILQDVSSYYVTSTVYSTNSTVYVVQDVSYYQSVITTQTIDTPYITSTLYDPSTNYYAATNPFYLSDLRIYSADISNTLSSWFCNLDSDSVLLGSAFDNNIGGLVCTYGLNAIGSVNSAVMNTGILSADTVSTSNLSVNGISITNPNPTGSIVAYAGTTDPTGWVICNGVKRTNNSDSKYNTVASMGIGTLDVSNNYTPPNMSNPIANMSTISWIIKL